MLTAMPRPEISPSPGRCYENTIVRNYTYIYFLVIGVMVTHLTTVVSLHHGSENGRTTSRNVGANIPFEQAEVCLEVPPPPLPFSDDYMFVISLARNINESEIFIRQTAC